MKRHAPLWLYTRLLCDAGPPGERRVRGSPVLNFHCSKRIAERKLQAAATTFGVPTAMSLRLHVAVADIVVWLINTAQMFISHALVFLFIYVPSAYVAVNLLRHVDSATASASHVAAVGVYAYAPLLVMTDIVGMCLRLDWLPSPATAEPLLSAEKHEILVGSLEVAVGAFWAHLFIFVLWTAYIFVGIRAEDERIKCAAASAARTRGMERAAEYDDASTGEPMCRICLGDEEDGRLISPCLCKGSMRFVHVECLTMWRTSSANKESFFACDSCKYRYSFGRPAWASLLRSALCVHFVSLVLFLLLIASCGHLSSVLDYLFFGGGLAGYLTDSLSLDEAQLAELKEIYGEAGLLSMDQLSLLGLSMAQLTTGAAIVGLAGFVSSGFLYALLWGRRDNGIFIFAVLYGLIHSFIQVYGMVKDRSARWLKMVESTVLDVGDGLVTRAEIDRRYSVAQNYYSGSKHEPALAAYYGGSSR